MKMSNFSEGIDKVTEELNNKKAILDLKVETQVILSLLVEKEIVSREEVAAMREKIRRSPKYKAAYAYLDQCADKITDYKDDPSQLLKDIFNAKMKGQW